jgi:predicted Zn-dependent protease
MEGATATTRVRTRDGGVVDLRLAAIREAPGRIYRFLFISPPEVTGRLDASFQATISSFRRLTAAEAQAIKPLRIRIVTVKAGDTPQSMAARMAVDSYPLEHFLVLNGLQPGDSLRPGDKVKIISE